MTPSHQDLPDPLDGTNLQSSEIDLSLLVISFNCWEHLKACLMAFCTASPSSSEIIVVDNASVDGTAGRLIENFPHVRLVVNSENIGHTKAVNQGVKLAHGKRILLVDADTEFLPGAVERLCQFMDVRKEAWMAAPRTLNTDGTIQETARNFPSPLSGIFGRQSLLAKVLPNNFVTRRYLARENLEAGSPFQVEFVSAACMLFDRRVVEKVGQLDEKYPGYWVDADWCKRIQKSGGAIYCVPNAVMYHHEQNKSSRRRNPSRIIDFHTGVHRFYRLHYTVGLWDPRSFIAAILLAVRSLVLLTLNHYKKPEEDYVDPLSLQ